MQRSTPSEPVAAISVVLPSAEFFVLETTLPVPPRTVLDDMDRVPLAIARGDVEFTTQVEIVSRYPQTALGADVVELIARVQRPAGANPGDEVVFDVVRADQDPGPPATTDAVVDLIYGGGVRLRARDVFGNEYDADLFDRVRQRHPSVRTLREGALVQETLSHEVMAPLDTSVQGPTRPAPHLLGVHVITRTYGHEDFLAVDLIVHNGMWSQYPTALDDPIDDVYFDELALEFPSNWSVQASVEAPGFGDPVVTNGVERHPLVESLRYGQYHLVPQQAQFVRRLILARGPEAAARGRSVLKRETRGFCVPEDGKWSWWNPETARFQTTNTPLPRFDHVSRSGLVSTIATDFQTHLAQLRSGAEGPYPRFSPVLGWSQPWGVAYGGMTGGDEIEMYPNMAEAWARHPKALRKLELRSRAYIDRQRAALFDLDGRPPYVDEHVVAAGTPDAFVPTSFFLTPAPHHDYFGFESVDRRFTESAYATGRVPYYAKALARYQPIDLAHLTRFLNPHLGLVWLANDAVSKIQLELSSALFHMSFHEHLNSGLGFMESTGFRIRIEETLQNPGQGGNFGRTVAWGLVAAASHYAISGEDERARIRPWLRNVAETARRAQSTCTGNPTANPIQKHFKGVYRSRQAFEVGYFVNAAHALLTTVFEGVDGQTTGILTNLIVDAAYSTITPPFWNEQTNGQEPLVGVRPRDPALPEFCFGVPPDAIFQGNFFDHTTAMPAWAFAYRETNDPLFLQRTTEALGASGSLEAAFEARG
ncbi:MAG: hypothetical protein AAGA20_23350, partial [Planctomycetota bacterium]